MTGSLMVWLALAAGIVSSGAYFFNTGEDGRGLRRARLAFLVMAAAVAAASVLLMLYIVRHQFEYSYVWAYSSRDLSMGLLISTFWAGQEGSFMLWCLFSSLIGVAFLRYALRNGIEREAISVYALLQSFLLLLLTIKSPFQYIWNAFPGEAAIGVAPPDGRGLNPLLQNFWMIIHPPVMFLGFAAMAVPFCLTVVGLWKKSYTTWVSLAQPWVLFAAVALGTGLILGGYWAYGVLGWGGWWGWDPVENSSLIPWIVGVALVHTLIVQRKTGKLVRTNAVLGLLSYVLVIYSTFLTRSGVLSDASVHSFVDPGALSYWLLVVWMMGILGFSAWLVSLRWKEMKTGSEGGSWLTRESLLSLGAAALGVSALIVFAGTSLPLVSNSTVEPSFYDSSNLPVAIVMVLLIGFSLLAQYRVESGGGLFRRSLAAIAISAAGVAGLVVGGLDSIHYAALAFASIFGLVVSVRHGYRMVRDRPLMAGGALAHIGVAVLFLGIIGSGPYGVKTTMSLPLGETREVHGYRVTFMEHEVENDGRHRFLVSAVRNGREMLLEPRMFFSAYNNNLMREPDYATVLLRDFYLEPVSLEEVGGRSSSEASDLELMKGETKAIPGGSVTFVSFDMGQHQDAAAAQGGVQVGAVLDVKKGPQSTRLVPVTVFRQGAASVVKRATLSDGSLGFELTTLSVGMDGAGSKILLKMFGPVPDGSLGGKTEVLVVEASTKPFMILVWVGAGALLLGLTVAGVNRIVESSFASSRGRE